MLTLSTPLGSMALFVAGTVLVYRFVPSITPPMRVLLPPALLVGLVLAVFAQLFTFIGPLLVATITAATMDQKSGMVVLLSFFLIGLALLLRIRD